MDQTWLEPWNAVSPSRAEELEAELHRELGPGHVLFGVHVQAVACRQDCDDVLFRIIDQTHRVVVVHLTWTSQGPERTSRPRTELFENLDAWRSDRMSADHREFVGAP